MKKLAGMLLLCALILGMFSGCERRGASGSARSSRSATTPTAETENSGRRSLTRQEILEARNAGIPETTAPAQRDDSSQGGGSSQGDGASQDGGGFYSDERVPHYNAANPQWKRLRFDWKSKDRGESLSIEVSVDATMYAYYRDLGRYYSPENFFHYVNDANNEELVDEVVQQIMRSSTLFSHSSGALVRELANFVQEVVTYQYDVDTTGEEEYPRYPIETLYERQGDCEDTSILMAALLKAYGYEVGFIHLPGHLAVALRTSDDYSDGPYVQMDGHRYLYIESTSTGWNIGDIPDEVIGEPAYVYLIP